jgi:hypothetical protein
MLLTPHELAAAARRQTDFDDLMLELSGFTRGGIARFLRPEQIRKIRQARGEGGDTPNERAWRRYLKMTDELARQLFQMNRAIDRALVKSARRVREAREALQVIQERATIDQKGRRVYRTADRTRAFTDEGQELSREEIESIQWKADAPTWEQRQAAGNRLAQAEKQHEEILHTKDRADYYGERLRSGDILSADELDTMKADLNAMPSSVKAEMANGHSIDTARMDPSKAKTADFKLDVDELASMLRTDSAISRPSFTPK